MVEKNQQVPEIKIIFGELRKEHFDISSNWFYFHRITENSILYPENMREAREKLSENIVIGSISRDILSDFKEIVNWVSKNLFYFFMDFGEMTTSHCMLQQQWFSDCSVQSTCFVVF